MSDLLENKGFFAQIVDVTLTEVYELKLITVSERMTPDIVIMPRSIYGRTIYLQPSGVSGWLNCDIDLTDYDLSIDSILVGGLDFEGVVNAQGKVGDEEKRKVSKTLSKVCSSIEDLNIVSKQRSNITEISKMIWTRSDTK